MPITPKFTLRQDDTTVYVEIEVPYLRINDTNTDIYVDTTEFNFYCKPYLLKLNFHNEFNNDEKCKALYDPTVVNGIVTCHLVKKNSGEIFQDLELLTNLMQKKRRSNQPSRTPKIQVLSSEEYSKNLEQLDSDQLDDDESIEPTEVMLSQLKEFCYGFNRQYSNVFRDFEDFGDVFECTSDRVESVNPTRRRDRLKKENEVFDVRRYLSDLYGCAEDDVYTSGMAYQSHVCLQWEKWTKNEKVTSFSGYSDQEKAILGNKLYNKEYLIASPGGRRDVLLNLLSIVLAVSYDVRLTLGESNVESCRNITRLCGNFSHLDDFQSSTSDSVQDVLVHFIRRSLIYPYIRHWKFTRKVIEDVTKLCYLGKKSILKTLLYAYELFDHSDTMYLINKVYVEDYCIWIQQVDNAVLYALGDEMNACKKKVTKADVALNLIEIEAWAAAQQGCEEDDCTADGSVDALRSTTIESLLPPERHEEASLLYIVPSAKHAASNKGTIEEQVPPADKGVDSISQKLEVIEL